jgi:hypothetical protein
VVDIDDKSYNIASWRDEQAENKKIVLFYDG